MRILNFLQNKKIFCKKNIFSSSRDDKGFTILECILAVGILSAVLASLVGLQSSIIYVAQNSMDKLKASWAMKQANAQIDYVLNSAGLSGIPENSTFVWSGDNKFTISIQRKDLNEVKPSQFLITALKFYNMANSSDGDTQDEDKSLAPITQFLDNIPMNISNDIYENKSKTKSVDQSNFVNIFVTVNWTSGSVSSVLTDGLFLLDYNTLSNIKLPSLGENQNSNGNNSNTPPNNNAGGTK
jgi:hypothetical protein